MAEKQNEVKYSVNLPKRSGKSNLTLSLDKINAFLDNGKEVYQVCSTASPGVISVNQEKM